jgi:hypothetical protein
MTISGQKEMFHATYQNISRKSSRRFMGEINLTDISGSYLVQKLLRKWKINQDDSFLTQ